MRTVTVRLPNGQEQPLTYPDEWSDEQVEKAIHEQFSEYSQPDENSPEINERTRTPQIRELPPANVSDAIGAYLKRSLGLQSQKPASETGLSAVGKDALSLLSGTLKGLEKAPGQLGDVGKQFAQNPLQAALHNIGQLGVGAAELGKGTLNLPSQVAQYAGKRELLGGPLGGALMQKTGQQMQPIPEDTGVEKALGLEATRKGDPLVRMIPAFATMLKGGLEVRKSPVKTELKNIESQIEEATEGLNLTKEQTAKLKEALEEQFAAQHGGRPGKLTPSGQRVEQNIKQAAIKEKEGTGLEEGVDMPSESPNELVKKSKSEMEQAQEQLSKALNANKDQSKRGGEHARQLIMQDKDRASKLYEDVRGHYDKNQVKIDNSKEIGQLKSELEELKNSDPLAPGYGAGSESQQSLENQINALSNQKVEARDLFDLGRTLEKRASDLRKKQYSGVDDLEFKRLGDLATAYEGKAKSINKLLETTGDEAVRNKLKEANKLWADYSSLKKHPAGRSILYDTKLPQNFIKSISGTRAGSEYLQKIAESSPEVRRNALGLTHSRPSKHAELLNPNEALEPYLEGLPEVQKAIENFSEKKEAHAKTKQLAESLKNQAQINKLEAEIKSHRKTEKELQKQIDKEDKIGNDITALKQRQTELQDKINNKESRLKKIKEAFVKGSAMKYWINKAGF